MAKAVKEALPHEDIIYFGDTARVPYGIKSEETVCNYALEITQFLLDKGVKMILIACNTVSASAKEDVVRLAGEVPVLDVISSGVETVKVELNTSEPTVGVIGTLATVRSEAYKTALESSYSNIHVVQEACPLLVPLAEEGWIDHAVARLTLQHYLKAFEHESLDAIILGCTHYPLFKPLIAELLHSKETLIIDSAVSIARTAKEYLEGQDGCNTEGGSFSCYVSDRPQRFQELAERFLGHQLSHIEIVREWS